MSDDKPRSVELPKNAFRVTLELKSARFQAGEIKQIGDECGQAGRLTPNNLGKLLLGAGGPDHIGALKFLGSSTDSGQGRAKIMGNGRNDQRLEAIRLRQRFRMGRCGRKVAALEGQSGLID